MIWSSWREPVPPILRRSARAASANSRTVFQGEAALTQSTNSSSASIFTGVRSRQLKGTPVASGVVKRLDSVMTSMCGLPRAPLASRKPSAPAPPALFTTTSGWRISECLDTMPWITRAIWSAPPPVPAGTMNCTGRFGSQARWASAGEAASRAGRPRAAARREMLRFVMRFPDVRLAKVAAP